MAGNNGIAYATVASGGVLLYAAIKGKSITQSIQYLVMGKNPATAPSANQITGVTDSKGTGPSSNVTPPQDQTGPPVKGIVDSWISRAWAIDPSIAQDRAAYHIIIEHESGGNPFAINLSDSNAAAGHPSEGIMQTIKPTFDEWALPGHTNIWNPVDNIIAGARYAISRYGSISNVPGVIAVRAGQSYVGY